MFLLIGVLEQTAQGGFRGSPYMTTTTTTNTNTIPQDTHNPAHLPSTYTAILVLGLLRADFSRLNVDGLQQFLHACQEPDGSSAPVPLSTRSTGSDQTTNGNNVSFESDARMVYCAAVISQWIRLACQCSTTQSRRDTNSIEVTAMGPSVDKTRQWIQACQSWEGGFGGRPGLEAQGGTTYCCLAASTILLQDPSRHVTGQPSIAETAKTWSLESMETAAVVRWLAQRQVTDGHGGFQGRPGKDEDVCYSFWCGAALRVSLHVFSRLLPCCLQKTP